MRSFWILNATRHRRVCVKMQAVVLGVPSARTLTDLTCGSELWCDMVCNDPRVNSVGKLKLWRLSGLVCQSSEARQRKVKGFTSGWCEHTEISGRWGVAKWVEDCDGCACKSGSLCGFFSGNHPIKILSLIGCTGAEISPYISP